MRLELQKQQEPSWNGHFSRNEDEEGDCHRPLVNRGSEANFAGTSQAMEGEGTLRIAKEMKAAGFVVKKFLHDGDSSSFASILQVFPACQEYSCINHACKNIRKHVKTRMDWRGLGKQMQKLRLEVDERSQRSSIARRLLVRWSVCNG